MKKHLLLCQIILIAVFVLFAAATTAYTLLDAFVLDREIFDPDVSITQDPTFTLLPPKPATPVTTTQKPTAETTAVTPPISQTPTTGTSAPIEGTSPITTVKTPVTT